MPNLSDNSEDIEQEEQVIVVDSISKMYRIGVIDRKMLVDQIESYFARKFGREDPHSLIGEKNNNVLLSPSYFFSLRSVSFNINRGDRVGILGKNGSGKSTLLKILSRITTPTSGMAYINGRVVSLLEVGIGFHPELTGRENIYLNSSILGMKKKEINQIYNQIVEFSGITKFIDTPIRRYSSGMKMRLGFAIASHLESEILILDEILAVGDIEFQEKCLNKIQESANSKKTILLVSHDLGNIKKICNRVLILEDGKIVCNSNTEEGIEFYLTKVIINM